jgi:putative selenium metabolism protein SsnA
VEGESIVAVGPNVVAQPDDECVDCGGAVVLPGLVNGHTHLYAALATGMPAPPQAPRNFHEILSFIWWRLDRAHDLESIKASAQVGGVAALRCGTTTLIDHHASPNCIEASLDALALGLTSAGCRGVLCYEVTDRNGPGEAEAGLAENERFARACCASAAHEFAGMVGAHASFTLSEVSLAAIVDVARQLQRGIHIHVAEDPLDERQTRHDFGCGLLERFRRAGVFEVPDTIFAHGTHLSEYEVAMVNECDSIWMAHNPTSNMNNAVGYAPVADFRRAPLLGTDGIGGDLWRESRTALVKSHDAGRSISYNRPLQMLGRTAKFASRQLGVRLGVLQPGAAADIVVTDYYPATPLTADNLSGHFLFGLGAEYVRHVMVAGRWCLRDRQVTWCDEAELRRDAVRISRRLFERLQQIPPGA